MTNQTVPFAASTRFQKNGKRLPLFMMMTIEVPNVYAWVCPVDGEASFTSDTTDELIETGRDLVTPAKRARPHAASTG